MHWRNITVDGVKYKWAFGRATIVVKTAEGKKIGFEHASRLLEITPDEWDRAKWKGGGYQLHPSHVAKYIRNIGN